MGELILLQGVVGSKAYGLDHADSDTDRLGVFMYPIERCLGLDYREESIVRHEPDLTLHEIGKYLRLLLNGNPAVVELLFLEEYEIRTGFGSELIQLRSELLGAGAIRRAYLGYATQQLQRLVGRVRENGDVSRVPKHARHLRRLLTQGLELYTTGTLTLRLPDPETYFEFGERVLKDPYIAQDLLSTMETAFNETQSPLPAEPNRHLASSWLISIRKTQGYIEGGPKDAS